jgi:hypothetical protein
VWELIVFMVLLKIPVAYLCGVVWYSIRATPNPPQGAGLVPVVPEPEDPPRPRAPRPRLRRLDPNGRARSRARTSRRPARKAPR